MAEGCGRPRSADETLAARQRVIRAAGQMRRLTKACSLRRKRAQTERGPTRLTEELPDAPVAAAKLMRRLSRGQPAGRWLAQLDRRSALKRCSNQRVDPVGFVSLTIFPSPMPPTANRCSGLMEPASRRRTTASFTPRRRNQFEYSHLDSESVGALAASLVIALRIPTGAPAHRDAL